MNLILLFESDFVGEDRSRVRIEGRRHRHVRKVLRATPGDVLTVGLAGGEVGEGRVVSLDREAALLDVVLTEPPPAPLDVTLVLAVPRPPVLRRSLAAAASFGVKRIDLVASARVEKSFLQSHAIGVEAIREQLVLGCEQARDTMLPDVRLHRRFGAFAEDVLPELVRERSGFVADAGGEVAAEGTWPKPALLAVGPEGGWVPDELERFAQAGLRAVALGERALRVETALAGLLGRFL